MDADQSRDDPPARTALPRRGYRPMPHDFPETFARCGWESIEDECHAHKTTIKRWMIDYGEEALQRMRRDYLTEIAAREGRKVPGTQPGKRIGAKYWTDSDRPRAKRYVLGRTLGGK